MPKVLRRVVPAHLLDLWTQIEVGVRTVLAFNDVPRQFIDSRAVVTEQDQTTLVIRAAEIAAEVLRHRAPQPPPDLPGT
jgi:hypothetical protein